MTKYTVKVIEYHAGYVTVEADSVDDAREKANIWISENELQTAFDRTADTCDWPVMREI